MSQLGPGSFVKNIASQPLRGFEGVEGLENPHMRRRRSLAPSEVRRTPVESKDVFDSLRRNILFLPRGWIPRVVQITTIPTLIIEGPFVRPISILNSNPSSSGSVASIESAWESRVGVNASGNNQANFLSLSNYLYMHLFCSVTAVTGSWTFYSQARNLATGNWADCEKLWTGVDAPEELYSIDSAFAVPTTRALRWTMDSAGAISFSLAYSLKEFTGGSPGGLSQACFLGPNDGVSPISGYPLRGGDSLSFILDEHAQIWGVAQTLISINVFEF